MLKKIVLLLSWIAFVTGIPAHAATVLINFGETAYTTDGVNTWQTFDINDGSNDLVEVSGAALVDTGNASTGLDLSVSGSGSVNVFSRADDEVPNFDNITASWFDTSVAEQRETYSFGSAGNTITYTFSGFSTTDIVDFDFVVARAAGSATTRSVTVTSTLPETVINNQNTHTGGLEFTASAYTGATSYAFTFEADPGDGIPATANAIRIVVIPEPGTFALVGLAFGCLFICRRR